jgi:signal transduction histidine kinase/ligand-binding sensor domain-containing protein
MIALGIVLARALLACSLAAGLALAWPPCAFALNPALDVSQYAHTAWAIREGFSDGTITSIAQTPDGYLWLGTEFGLLRFDGVRSDSWQPPTGTHLPSSFIRTLLATRDGSLWIGTAEGLASWKDGKLTLYPELAGQAVDALLEDREGAVWAGGQAAPTARLCAIQGGNTHCYGDDGSLGQYVESLYEDSRGNLWVGTMTGVWLWKSGPSKFYPMPNAVLAVVEAENGAVLLAMRNGISQLVDGKASAYPLPAALGQVTPRELLRDANGGLWIGTTDQGLVHVHQGRADVFAKSDGLSGDFVKTLFADHEGNIWVATLDGLDRFRDFSVPTISVKQGLSNGTVESVLAARDGSVWLGTVDGLDRWDNGQITIYRTRSAQPQHSGQTTGGGAKRGEQSSGVGPASGVGGAMGAVREISDHGLPDDSIESLFQDDQGQIWVATRSGIAYLENGRFIPIKAVSGVVHSITGDLTGSIWVSQAENLFHLLGGSVVEQIPWPTLGHPDGARVLVADHLKGGLWIGFRDGGVAYFKDGQLRESYAVADGLGEGHIRDAQLDRDGTLWVATEGGLSRIKNGHAATLTSKNGLPCDAVHWAREDDAHSLWLYTACGLVHIEGAELDAWVRDPKRTIHSMVFDSSDGVRAHATTTGYCPSVAKSSDGKLWFLPWDGVSVIDPAHLSVNKLPPPISIQQIVADRTVYDAVPGLRLPARVRDVWIDYTALSFAAPERVRFRYKLEGQDPDWKEVVNVRQAQYSNLAPGNYRFRVTACNNNGVWNPTGAFLDFSVAPAYYQTNWFRVSCAAALLLLLWAIYQLRVRSIEQRYHERKQAEDALRQAQADLEYVNRVTTMGELTAALAHELNQPIAAAITNANTCIRWLDHEKPNIERAQAAALRIVNDGTRAAEIIKRTRLLFKKGGHEQEPIDINDVIRETITLLRDEIIRNSILFLTDLQDLPQVLGDRVRLQQVLMNLVMNSIDAMKDLDGTRELLITSQRGEDGQVLVSVSDTGVGLPPQHADQIFNAFFTTKADGTGMGLRISQSIVESHGGRLWAADNSPRGAVFSFTLPSKNVPHE